jgi:HD-GYP domain-containing protein (c-di-GMP phosphodiesterase class II)
MIGATSFVALAAAAPFALESDRSPPGLFPLLFVLAFALAVRVEFEIGRGSVVPTQLVLVPMLFVLPLGIVPACVGAAFLFADLPLYLSRSGNPERVTVRLLGSWYVIGPVAVLYAAGESPPQASDWPLYTGALVAQFIAGFAAAAGAAWFAFRIRPSAQIRALAAGWAVDAALAPVGLFVAVKTVDSPYVFLGVVPLTAMLGLFARERRARITHALELSSAYRGTALLLGDLVEADDRRTGAHSREVVALVRAVCERLHLDTRSLHNAEFVALLHDIGKIRVPKEIINKPGPLTASERRVIERHTIEGETMLGAVGGILAEVGRLVRSCHERWDGYGYPDGLAGEQIPLIARVVYACDAFSAITTTRSYQSGRSATEALAELRRCAGTHFDPHVVAVLAAVVENGFPAAEGVLRPLHVPLGPIEPEPVTLR